MKTPTKAGYVWGQDQMLHREYDTQENLTEKLTSHGGREWKHPACHSKDVIRRRKLLDGVK